MSTELTADQIAELRAKVVDWRKGIYDLPQPKEWRCSTGCVALDALTPDIMLALIAAAEENARIKRITLDSGSLNGMKIEYHDDGRFYAYAEDGSFLWSGPADYNVWRCIQLHSENAKLRAEVEQFRRHNFAMSEQMEEMECASTEQTNVWRMERTAFYEMKQRAEAAEQRIAALEVVGCTSAFGVVSCFVTSTSTAIAEAPGPATVAACSRIRDFVEGVIRRCHAAEASLATAQDAVEVARRDERAIVEEVARRIEADPHLFGKRPCATCNDLTESLGRPFGCAAIRSRTTQADTETATG